MNADEERFATNTVGKPTACREIGKLSENAIVILDPVGNKFSVWSDKANKGTYMFTRIATHDEVHQAMANYEQEFKNKTRDLFQKFLEELVKYEEHLDSKS